MKKHLFIVIILSVLLGVFFFSQSLLSSKNYLSFQLSGFLRPVASLFQVVTGGENNQDELAFLKRENEMLKAELLALKKEPIIKDKTGKILVFANVYSTYPFNNRNLLSINAGLKKEIKAGFTATIGGNLLLGQVVDSYENYSLVRTIFDPGWEIPVKIDNDGIDALLIGGREPRLALITKDKELKTGDVVYSASQEFPYGLRIGEINAIKNDVGDAFQEADLSLFYEPKDITEVVIIIK